MLLVGSGLCGPLRVRGGPRRSAPCGASHPRSRAVPGSWPPRGSRADAAAQVARVRCPGLGPARRTAGSSPEAGLAEFGRIGVVVNNAGYGPVGAVEETSDRAARALFDVNVFGVLNTLRATLPTLRAQRSGHVLNIGSVGGFATAPAAGLYGASKFALEGISEALHGELAPLGVRVTIVEPGGLRTDFLNSSSMRVEPASIADHVVGAGPVREALAHHDGRQPGDPVKAAKAIVDITEVTEPPLRLQLGADAIERVEAKLDRVRRELDEWRHVALSTGI
ncbi:SDR family NAD(P)-dependent oxidoreductase [Streptomyces sp. NPDC012600]|uniref:SDR family NAD(P)-dependent oxidoreductase n=1 Tax=Streptomyces sp. NPDC012600 TaxID=3415005 RepID=UPI003C2ED2BF